MRVYLTGRIGIEADGAVRLEERQLPGRQGRLAFVYLAMEHRRPVPREELADALWGDSPPAAWDGALSAVVSKLRALVRRPELAEIESAAGCYRLSLPAGTWIDVEVAADALHDAEGMLHAGRPREAWASANVAAAIAQRPLLPGLDVAWVDRVRDRLADTRVRALDCLAESYLANGEEALAIRSAADAVELEPYRESGYRRLMRIHLQVGNRGEAVRVYERCRRLLAEELGVEPSHATMALIHEARDHLPPGVE